MKRLMQLLASGTLLAAVVLLVSAAPAALASSPHAKPPPTHKIGHMLTDDEGGGRLDCQDGNPLCTEVLDSIGYNGSYTGHDEPSLLFYSNKKGSGYTNQYRLTLPTDPVTPPAQDGSGGTAYFQKSVAFWVGMALCDTQSYPLSVSTCPADSDTNIANNPNSSASDFIGNHSGTAFMEMQFYPPGWVSWPAGTSCDATQWCASLNIDSLSERPADGTTQNATCSHIAGLEYVNFAFITKDGVPDGPPNPVNSTVDGTFTPHPGHDLFMNPGDEIQVTLQDTSQGLKIAIKDITTGESGKMVASAANGFGQVQYDPTGTSCNNIPYDFHPMYATSSEDTRVVWAAHSYNIAYSDEIGHFDYCSAVAGGGCSGTESLGEANDADDTFCYDSSLSTHYSISGCQGTNAGFDGTPYDLNWAGTYANHGKDVSFHGTPLLFNSPKFKFRATPPAGAALAAPKFTTDYNRVAFETDLPRVSSPPCNRSTGAGCINPPITDDGNPAQFYPIFTTGTHNGGCTWQEGGALLPGTTKTFGGNSATEYGPLSVLTYQAFGSPTGTITRFNDFRRILSSNPCPAP